VLQRRVRTRRGGRVGGSLGGGGEGLQGSRPCGCVGRRNAGRFAGGFPLPTEDGRVTVPLGNRSSVV